MINVEKKENSMHWSGSGQDECLDGVIIWRKGRVICTPVLGDLITHCLGNCLVFRYFYKASNSHNDSQIMFKGSQKDGCLCQAVQTFELVTQRTEPRPVVESWCSTAATNISSFISEVNLRIYCQLLMSHYRATIPERLQNKIIRYDIQTVTSSIFPVKEVVRQVCFHLEVTVLKCPVFRCSVNSKRLISLRTYYSVNLSKLFSQQILGKNICELKIY